MLRAGGRLLHSISLPALVVLAAIPFVEVASGAEAAPADLKAMSFNVRYSKPDASEERTENNWNDPAHPRRERAIRAIIDYRPDVLGVQEARYPQVKDLQAALVEYDFYGIGRDDGQTEGEFSGIFYRRDRFDRLQEGSFWLSATPKKPGTTFYTKPGAVPRIASWMKLADKQSGRELLVLNMHWDNESEPARRQSATLVRERLSTLAKGLPTIVMGDLNAHEDSPAIRELIGQEHAEGPRLFDSYRVVYTERKPAELTFNNWRGGTKGSRIDFILVSDALEPTAASIVRTAYDGRWPSDHYPVTATLRWQNSQR